MPDGGATAGSGGPSQRLPGARAALALLLVINLFNYIDRQVLSAVLPLLEVDADLFDPADPHLGFKLGLLTSAFLVSYTLLSPVFGWFGDRTRRWLVVGIGVSIWSLASGASGLAAGYLMLLLTRCLVGIGEAAYGPVAPSMLSDMYPVKVRGKIMAYFYLAIPVGSALGFVIGGQMAEHFGWREAFLITLLGLIPAAICFGMREPPRPVSPGAVPFPVARESPGVRAGGPSYFAVMRELRTIRSFVLCCAGMTCTTFMLGGVAAWTPRYIFQREARFEITGATIEQLRVERNTKKEPLVPPAIVEKLVPLLGGGVKDFPQMKVTLLEKLGNEELKQYGERIYSKATKAKYQITESVLTTLRKTREGEPEVPAGVIDALKQLLAQKGVEFPQFEESLRGVLSEEDLKQYAGFIYRAATVSDSITLGKVNFLFGLIVVLSGLGATLLGGITGDKMRDCGYRGAYFKAAGWTTLVAWPFFVAVLFVPFPMAWLCLFVAVFFLFFNTGPANTILANVTRSEIRATAFAINILIIHVLGDVISPPLIGLINDFSNLHTAFLIVSLAIPAGGLLWVWGARSLDEDTRRAEGGETPPAVSNKV
ncbi:MAG TPA: MFS transporter [Gemmata sp.]|nr:MFS transporter [Gemmata sp.]